MILQCEQCNTRFRLDDSKLKPGGVKVRCSKCRHVFIAGAEPPQEETDFDAILSGLGASAQQPAEAPVPPAVAAAAPEPEAPPEGAPEEEGAPEGAPAAADDFSFDFTPSAAEEPAGAGREFAGVSEFSFEPEPRGEAPAADFAPSDFSFEAEPAAKGAGPLPTEEMAGFNEFSFEDEPSAKELEPPPSGLEVAGFQEFSFEEEPAVPAAPSAPAEEEKKPAEFSFGEFSFEAEGAEAEVKPGETAAGGGEFDFGEFSFDAEEAPEAERKVPEFDLSDFTFEGDADRTDLEGAAEEEGEPGFGGFALAEESAAPAQKVALQEEEGFGIAEEDGGRSSFSFGEEPAAVAPVREREGAAAAPEEPEAPEAASLAAAGGIPLSSLLDFDKVFGDSAAGAPHGAGAEAEEELPPLGISSRRKRRPAVTASLALLSLLLLAALAGGGFYLMKSGPAAFDRLGLGFVPKWFGLEGAEEGKVVIVNPVAAFYQNKEAGELFVVSGQAENQFRKPRASVHVKVSIFDKSGRTILQKTAYCGNRLSEEQLTTLPLAKLDAAMNNQFGDSLSNLGVKPGEKIPFVVAIANVPKEAADFDVQVIGSTVAGQ